MQWGRIGCIGFDGPPTHIALLRDLCVERKQWIDAHEFEDAIAACNLLPGPASTQLAILSAWTVAGPLGAFVGGLAFIVPGLIVIIGLAAVFLASSPPTWVLGAGAGAGAAVAVVAVHAGIGLIPASLRARPRNRDGSSTRSQAECRPRPSDRGSSSCSSVAARSNCRSVTSAAAAGSRRTRPRSRWSRRPRPGRAACSR